MNKFSSIWQLFRQGQSVVDPAKWKNRQITATVLAGVILAIVNTLAAFGYSLPIDADTANAIAAGVIAVVNVVLTITTTDRIGLKPSESPSVETSEQHLSKDTKNGTKANQEPSEGVPDEKTKTDSTGYLADIYK